MHSIHAKTVNVNARISSFFSESLVFKIDEYFLRMN